MSGRTEGGAHARSATQSSATHPLPVRPNQPGQADKHGDETDIEPLRLAGHEAAADDADALQRPQRADGQHNQGQQIFGQFH